MCWLDRDASTQIQKLRDRFRVKTFVETGAAEGNGALFYAHHFNWVWSTEITYKLFRAATQRTRHLPNVIICRQSSPEFLRFFRRAYEDTISSRIVLFFLDAHSPGSWPILEELRELRGFRNCIIVIHDFKIAGLGHLVYEGQALDWAYVKDDLMKVNPKFRIYHNTREHATIWTPEDLAQGRIPGMFNDQRTRKQLAYAWSAPEKTYRGILYAVPEPLDETFNLVPMEER